MSALTLTELRTRLADVEAQLLEISRTLQGAPLEEHAGLFAHQAALLHKKHWYVSRIRAQVPVEPLGVHAHDVIKTGDGLS